MERCSWCLCNEKMIKYHDEEWGVNDHTEKCFRYREVMGGRQIVRKHRNKENE